MHIRPFNGKMHCRHNLKHSVLHSGYTLLLWTAPLLVSAAADDNGPQKAVDNEKLHVFVSILPQKDFVSRLGKPYVDARVLVRPEDSPATYAPPPRQLSALARADIFFRIGVPFEEAWLPRIRHSTRGLEIVDVRRDLELRHFSKIVFSRDPKAQSVQQEKGKSLDPHTWLHPRLVQRQAATMHEALCQADPAHKKTYTRNYETFCDRLDELHSTLQEILAPVKGQDMFVFHPAFGYFADAYELNQVAVELEGKSPTPRQLNAIIQVARERNVRTIFVQEQFSKRSAQAIAKALDAQIVALNPLPQDYFRGMKDMAQKIKAGLERQR